MMILSGRLIEEIGFFVPEKRLPAWAKKLIKQE